jgi:hypothetical protein
VGDAAFDVVEDVGAGEAQDGMPLGRQDFVARLVFGRMMVALAVALDDDLAPASALDQEIDSETSQLDLGLVRDSMGYQRALENLLDGRQRAFVRPEGQEFGRGKFDINPFQQGQDLLAQQRVDNRAVIFVHNAPFGDFLRVLSASDS